MKNKFNLGSVMIGTRQPTLMAQFYEKVFERPADWSNGGWYTWKLGECSLSIGEHSEMRGMAKDPGRIMFNLESEDVKNEFARIKKAGGRVVAEPYTMEGMEGAWISTLADPEGNYFQIVSPWEDEESE